MVDFLRINPLNLKRMRWFIILACVAACLFAVPRLHAAEGSLQTQYLNIYLKINDAEHLEKSGDFRGALADFKDCSQKDDYCRFPGFSFCGPRPNTTSLTSLYKDPHFNLMT